LNVDRPIAPWSDAHVQGVRLDRVAVLATNFSQNGHAIGQPYVRVDGDPEETQRVVLVVGVVEPRTLGVVLRRQRDRKVGADDHHAVGKGYRPGRQVLRARRARRAKDE
jgi:hypothetical protein